MGTSRSPGAGASRRWHGGRLAAAVLALGLAGGLLLVLAEVSTIASVEVPGRACREVADLRVVDRCELSGLERHGGALLLLGGLAPFVAFGAAGPRGRAAAAALLVIALLVLAFALLHDIPEAHAAGAIGLAYESATGKAGRGLYLEIAGAVMLAGAGGIGLARRAPSNAKRELTPREGG